MASDNLHTTQIHGDYLIQLRPYPDTILLNITSKIMRFSMPPFDKIFSLYVKPEQQEKPTLTGFHILLTMLIIALIITSNWAYKRFKTRCNRLFNGHEAIEQQLNEINQNIGNNSLMETNEREISQIPFDREMMNPNGMEVVGMEENAIAPEALFENSEEPFEQPMEVEIEEILEYAAVTDTIIDYRTNGHREIEQDRSEDNANQNQTTIKHRRAKNAIKAPVWRP